MVRGTIAERFWYRVPERGGGCWIWKGQVQLNGYGRFDSGGGKQRGAHRVAWELTNGPIPSHLEICHKCDVRDCVNPSHMFLGTRKDNMQDASAKGRLPGWRGKQTHCDHGHEFSGANTQIDTRGKRRCRACSRRRTREGRERNRMVA